MIKLSQFSHHQLALDLFSEGAAFMSLHNLQKDLICVFISEHLDDCVSVKGDFQLLQSVLVGPIIANTLEHDGT